MRYIGIWFIGVAIVCIVHITIIKLVGIPFKGYDVSDYELIAIIPLSYMVQDIIKVIKEGK